MPESDIRLILRDMMWERDAELDGWKPSYSHRKCPEYTVLAYCPRHQEYVVWQANIDTGWVGDGYYTSDADDARLVYLAR